MIYERSSTGRATALVASLDAIESKFTAFVRRCTLLLDPRFPQSGWRNQTHQGQWKSADQVTTNMQDAEDRIAVGLVDDEKLEIWWNVVVTATEVRGVSLELSVDGTAAPACVAHDRRDIGGSEPS